ncbi:MAG: hypothetical protein PHC34_07800 [Candidatus Gastranaerophilales bacterium]|nr:hypothetical protein [Candidatus Gastranaerophilales bacterium]
MKKDTSTDIKSAVMTQIKNNKIQMKPKVYYTILGISSIGAIILSGISIAYFSSIMFYWIKIQSANNMAWGIRAKLSDTLASFPWLALIIAIALMLVTIFLVIHQNRMYKYKISTIATIIITCSLLLGLLLSFIGVGSNSHMLNPLNKSNFQTQNKNIRNN